MSMRAYDKATEQRMIKAGKLNAVPTEYKFTVLGSTDEITTCDCCGKPNLKATFAVEINATGEILHYGSTCVTRNTGIKNPTKAANDYRLGLRKAASLKLRQSDEFRAYESQVSLRTAMNITPGLPSMNFVREQFNAKQERCRIIAAELSLEPYEVS